MQKKMLPKVTKVHWSATKKFNMKMNIHLCLTYICIHILVKLNSNKVNLTDKLTT